MENKIKSNDITEENIEETKNLAYKYSKEALNTGDIANEAFYYGQYIRSSIQQEFWEGKF